MIATLGIYHKTGHIEGEQSKVVFQSTLGSPGSFLRIIAKGLPIQPKLALMLVFIEQNNGTEENPDIQQVPKGLHRLRYQASVVYRQQCSTTIS